MGKLESDFYKDLIKGLPGSPCYHKKNHGDRFSKDFPDVTVMHEGYVCFAELKYSRSLPSSRGVYDYFATVLCTDMQLLTLSKIQRAGINARIIVGTTYQGQIISISIPALYDPMKSGIKYIADIFAACDLLFKHNETHYEDDASGIRIHIKRGIKKIDSTFVFNLTEAIL